MPGWSEEALRSDVKDRPTRMRLMNASPRVPVALYDERVSVPTNWPDVPCGYLDLTGEHVSAVEAANLGGWAVTVLEGSPLAPFVDPDMVAQTIVELINQL